MAPPPPPAPTIAGTITFQGTAKDYPDARRLDRRDGARSRRSPSIYVTSAQQVAAGDERHGVRGLTFTATAVPSPAAQSDRLNKFVKAANMKTKNLMVGILVGVLTPRAVVDDAPQAHACQGVEGEGRHRDRAVEARAAPGATQQGAEPMPRTRRSSRRSSKSLQLAMPNSPALAAFIRDANAIADQSGVAWQSVTHGAADAERRRVDARSRWASRSRAPTRR